MRTSPILLLLSACSSLDPIHFNEPPGAPSVSIAPAEAYTTDNLTVQLDAAATNPEGDALTYSYRWYVDGAAWAAFEYIDAASTQRGQQWSIEVVANDGEWDGPAGTAIVEVLNSPPAVGVVGIVPEEPQTTDDLVLAATGTDADDDNVSFSIRWFADDVEQAEFAGSLTVSAESTVAGEVWRVEVTPDDGSATGAAGSAEVKIGNAAPTLSGVSIYPDDPRTGESIAAEPYGLDDPDGDPLLVDYTWMVNGAVVYSETTDAVSYLIEDVHKGDLVSVSAQAYDGFAYSDIVLSDEVEVLNTPPSVEAATLTPTDAYEGTTLLCSGSGASDIDDDDVGYDYAWTVNGASVSSGSSSLTGSSFSRGDVVECTLTADDGDDLGNTVTSNSVEIQNTLPSLTTVSLSTSSPTALTGISATPSGWDDDDGDPAAYTYAWYVNGSVAGTNSSLSGGWLERGDAVYASVTPYDSYGSGAAVVSSTVTVANSAPSITSASLSPTPLYTDTNATASASGYSDADGDSASYSYQWYVEGAAVGSGSSSLSSARFDRGDDVYCEVTPSDGTDSGSTRATPTTTVQNSLPAVVATSLTTGTITECEEVQLDGSATTDADSDALTYTWSIGTKPAASGRSSSDIDATDDVSPWIAVDAGGTWKFNLSVNDGYGSASESVEIEVEERANNEVPAAEAGADQSIDVTSACSSDSYVATCPPCSDETFSLDASGTTDADGDPLSYTWSYTSATGVSIDSTSGATPTVTIGGMVPTYGSTSSVTATFTVTVHDCAGGSDTDTLTLTYSCMGI